jgi:hypothetical protein
MASAARLAFDAISDVTGAQADQPWAEQVHEVITEIEALKTSIAQAEAQNIVPGHWYLELDELQARLNELKANRPSELLGSGGGGGGDDAPDPPELNLPTLGKALDLLPRVTDETRRLEDAQRDLADSFRSAGETAGDALGRIIFDGAKAKDVIVQLLIQMARAQLTNSIGGLFGALAPTGGGGGFLSRLLSGLLGGGRDVGGPVQPGRIYKIGRPELFMPPSPGRIIPIGGAQMMGQRQGLDTTVRVEPSPLFIATVHQATRAAVADSSKAAAARQARYG